MAVGRQGWVLTLTLGLSFVQLLLSFGNPSCHFLEHDSLSLVGEGGTIRNSAVPGFGHLFSPPMAGLRLVPSNGETVPWMAQDGIG